MPRSTRSRSSWGGGKRPVGQSAARLPPSVPLGSLSAGGQRCLAKGAKGLVPRPVATCPEDASHSFLWLEPAFATSGLGQQSRVGRKVFAQREAGDTSIHKIEKYINSHRHRKGKLYSQVEMLNAQVPFSWLDPEPRTHLAQPPPQASQPASPLLTLCSPPCNWDPPSPAPPSAPQSSCPIASP